MCWVMGLINVDNQVSWLYTSLRCHCFFTNVLQPQLFSYWSEETLLAILCFLFKSSISIISVEPMKQTLIHWKLDYNANHFLHDNNKLPLNMSSICQIRKSVLWEEVCTMIQPCVLNTRWRLEFLGELEADYLGNMTMKRYIIWP